jgi:acetyl esterase/lipase
MSLRRLSALTLAFAGLAACSSEAASPPGGSAHPVESMVPAAEDAVDGDGCGPSRPTGTASPAVVVGSDDAAGADPEQEGTGDPVHLADNVAFTDGQTFARAEVRPAGGTVTTVDLQLDVYAPTDRIGPCPAIVLVHGGGFERRDRKDAPVVRTADRLASAGFVVVSIDYRLRPDGPIPSARMAAFGTAMGDGEFQRAVTAALDDTLSALDHVVDHAADLGVDPERIGLVGSSAGGITVDHLAYAATAFGIDHPPVRFVGSLWGGLLVPPPDGVEAPVANLIAATDPPRFAIHGTADQTVPIVLDDQIATRADEVGLVTEYHRIEGATHGYTGTRFFDDPIVGDRTGLDLLVAFALTHG